MSVQWMAIRGSGLVAFALLAGSTIWGLLISTKVLGRSVKAKPVAWFHESLAIGALLATGVHMFFLFTHDFIDFGYRDLFVPGASAWRPLATALGVISFYTMLIITVSFYVKKWIGQNAWRAIHSTSFGTFIGAALHGIFSGTDTANPVVLGTYVASLAVVAMLMTIRLAQAAVGRPVRPRRTAATRPPRRAETSAAEPADTPLEAAARG